MRPEHPIALITGALSDFGEATARLLAAQGYHLALGARLVERVQTLAVELSQVHGVKTFAAGLDNRSDSSVAAFVEGAVAALGGLHVIVANEGLAGGAGRLDSILEDDWQAILQTNVEGVVRVMKSTLPFVRKSGWGHYFTLGSTAGQTIIKGNAVNCASKELLQELVHRLRLELEGEPIRITSIEPIFAETEASLSPLWDENNANAVFQGTGPFRGEEIAECIRWALSLPDHVNIDEIRMNFRNQAILPGI